MRVDVERSLRLFEETAGPRTVGVAEALAELAQIFIWTDDYALAGPTVRAAINISIGQFRRCTLIGSLLRSFWPKRSIFRIAWIRRHRCLWTCSKDYRGIRPQQR